MSAKDTMEEFMTVDCPACNSTNTKVTQKIMDIPHFPNMWLFNLICHDCKYKYTDFINLNIKEPTRFTYHAENSDDYSTKIIRASNGTIRFPKISAMIEPGPNAVSFISNIEGVLRDIQEKARFLLNDAVTEEEKQRILDFDSMIDEYILKGLPIDVIVEDPFGNSTIVPFNPNKLETEKLSSEESERLKTSFSKF